MFLRFQMYKGYIEISDYMVLNQIEKDIKIDLLENLLNETLANRLYDLIKQERNNRLQIATV